MILKRDLYFVLYTSLWRVYPLKTEYGQSFIYDLFQFPKMLLLTSNPLRTTFLVDNSILSLWSSNLLANHDLLNLLYSVARLNQTTANNLGEYLLLMHGALAHLLENGAATIAFLTI